MHNRYPGVPDKLSACRWCRIRRPRRQQQQSVGCSPTFCSLPWPLLVAFHADLAAVQREQGCSTAACCNVLEASKPLTTGSDVGWGVVDAPGGSCRRGWGHNRGRGAGDTRQVCTDKPQLRHGNHSRLLSGLLDRCPQFVSNTQERACALHRTGNGPLTPAALSPWMLGSGRLLPATPHALSLLNQLWCVQDCAHDLSWTASVECWVTHCLCVRKCSLLLIITSSRRWGTCKLP